MKALKGLMEKVRKGEGGFTLIELLIVIIILGVLAAVVAFNVGGFLGAGTEETAKTERAAVQTAIMAGMANLSASSITGGFDIHDAPGAITTNAGTFNLDDYLHMPTHGYWRCDSSGLVTAGAYEGGGKCCDYLESRTPQQWKCYDGKTCNGTTCT